VQNGAGCRALSDALETRLPLREHARSRIPRGFGHSGFGGSGAWADPDRNLSVGMVLNSGMGTPFGDLRIVSLSTVAIRCADRR
jgi:CubicO group peptidase (beta-lactamase class C family)